MQPVFEQIMEQLHREIVGYEGLLDTLREERDILLTGDHDELLAISERKLGLARDLERMQRERVATMLQVLPGIGRRPRLADLEPHLPPEMKAGLRKAVRILTTLSERLSQANQNNKGYIEEALQTVEHILGAIVDSGPKMVYQAPNGHEARRQPRLLAREV